MKALDRDSRLGKFVIRERIGVGGMGNVYRAHDTVLGRTVAIKTLIADRTQDAGWLSRFRREALAISAINHPNIVQLFDFVEDDPPYLVMEYLPGQNLQGLIRKQEIPIARAVDILLDACDATSMCHRHGYIHRDLKATNIFLADYDGVEITKVLDFGVAKAWRKPTEGGADPSELTRHGEVVGTPLYLAPEILGGGRATPKSDQYSLGILLFISLTRRKPFQASNSPGFQDFHLWQAILKGDHKNACFYRPEIPEGLDQVIETALHKDADQRFASVHALGAALLPWASSRGRERWSDHFTSAPRPMVEHLSTGTSVAFSATGSEKLSTFAISALTTRKLEGSENKPSPLGHHANTNDSPLASVAQPADLPSGSSAPSVSGRITAPALADGVGPTARSSGPSYVVESEFARPAASAAPGISSVASLSADGPPPVVGPTASGVAGFLQRPRALFLLVGSLAVLAAAIAVFQGSSRSRSVRLKPPMEFIEQPVTRQPPSQTAQAGPPPAHDSLPTRLIATPVVEDPAARRAAELDRVPARVHKPKKTRPSKAQKGATVDRHGIAIPET